MFTSSTKTEDSEHVWWKHGVVYHIYPMSFYDSNHDGLGDLQGIISKLDYIKDLGVNSIWLSPIYKSPQKDFGYDISDYYEIDPIYGTMDDFNQLLHECYQRDIRLIMDLVMNHTSDQHPWFLESKSSKDNPKRDWYIWSDGLRKKPVNNWKNAFGGSAWQFDETTQSYYMHSFLKEQPDLNWRCKEMADDFFSIIDFWLQKGVDGFRLDVINMIVKDKQLRSNPVFAFLPWFQKHIYNRNRKGAFKIVERLRQHLDTYPNRISIGEIYVLPPGKPKTVMKYINKNKRRLHLAFDFSLVFRPFNARVYYKYLKKWDKNADKIEWATHVFSNHDLGRNYNRLWFRRNKHDVAKLIALFQFTVKGTPFIYYGEEIGMGNVRIPKNELKDPLGKKIWPLYTGRDKCRTPMQWDDDDFGGFSTVKPWLPIDTKWRHRCVKTLEEINYSILNHYKFLIALRNDNPALHKGDWIPFIKGRDGVLGYYRQYENQKYLILINFKPIKRLINLPEATEFKKIYSTNEIHCNTLHTDSILLNKFEGIILFDRMKKWDEEN